MEKNVKPYEGKGWEEVACDSVKNIKGFYHFSYFSDTCLRNCTNSKEAALELRVKWLYKDGFSLVVFIHPKLHTRYYMVLTGLREIVCYGPSYDMVENVITVGYINKNVKEHLITNANLIDLL